MAERFMKIGEFAQRLGLSTSTLRTYERKGILIPHHKTPHGDRYYTEEQYQNFIRSKGVSKINGG